MAGCLARGMPPQSVVYLYPRLYRISRQQEWSVSVVKEVEWNMDFRRRLGNEEVAEWIDLQEALELVELSEEEDVVYCGLWKHLLNSQPNLFTD